MSCQQPALPVAREGRTPFWKSRPCLGPHPVPGAGGTDTSQTLPLKELSLLADGLSKRKKGPMWIE